MGSYYKSKDMILFTSMSFDSVITIFSFLSIGLIYYCWYYDRKDLKAKRKALLDQNIELRKTIEELEYAQKFYEFVNTDSIEENEMISNHNWINLIIDCYNLGYTMEEFTKKIRSMLSD